MKGHVATAPLAIVDGTLLCVLPTVAAAADENDDDVLHQVPAVPCSEVWKHCGPKCVDVCELKTTTLNDNNADEENGQGLDGNMQLLLSSMVTIPMRSSDISKFDFRFKHPLDLLVTNSTDGDDNRTGSSSSTCVVQVSSSCDDNNFIMTPEKRMVWSSNNRDSSNCLLEICLPSMTSDDDDDDFEYCEDDCDVYGDTSFMHLSRFDGASSSTTTTKKKRHNRQASSFQLHCGGSCLIADFTGIGGYEQALILPQVDASFLILDDASISSSSSSSVADEILTKRKHMLQTILANSILTDGSCVFLPRNTEMQMATNSTTWNATVFKLPTVNRDVLSQCRQEHNSVESKPRSDTVNNPPYQQRTEEETDKMINKNVSDSSSLPIPPKDPVWLEAIKQTIESRLAIQAAKSRREERMAQVRSGLILKGRETIQKASRMNFTTATNATCPIVEDLLSNDPQIIRLRYGTRPRMSGDTQQKGLLAVIDLELDIVYLPNRGLQSTTTTHHGNDVLHDFHVSCTLASKSDRNDVTVDNTCTESGVVPILQSGNCVTILATVSLNELSLDFHTNSSESTTLDFNIQALWMDALQKRQGSLLCIVRLPLDGILFLPPQTSSYVHRAGFCIQHEISFISDDESSDAVRLIPSAVFDYRQPHTLNIDISGSISLQDGKIWKDLVTNLNFQLGMSSFIDLYYIKGDPTLKLVIFGANPSERAATTKFVIRNLPESAKLIEQNPNETKNVKALLASLKNEAEAFQRHRTMSKGNVTAAMHEEMASLQASTDGIASTIKRGWV